MRLCDCLPEECLEVLGQLSSAGVSGIHCDEDADRGRQRDVFRQEVECGFLLSHSVLDALDLHGHDRQDLDRDTIELVETAPRTGLRQTLVDVANRLHISKRVILANICQVNFITYSRQQKNVPIL